MPNMSEGLPDCVAKENRFGLPMVRVFPTEWADPAWHSAMHTETTEKCVSATRRVNCLHHKYVPAAETK